jgi:hypothetical protein
MLKTEAIFVNESGQAPIMVEIIGPQRGRVVDAMGICNVMKAKTLFYPVCKNDIVRLSHNPGDGDGLPRVTEIIFKALPRFLSQIEYCSREQQHRLIALAAVLGAEIQYFGVHETQAFMWVLHSETVNLPAIAKAAGIGTPGARLKGTPHNRCTITVAKNQRNLAIALVVVLGAEICEVYEAEETSEITLLHPDGLDMAAVADAARLSVDANEWDELDLRELPPPPRAVAGPEWQAGSWGTWVGSVQPIDAGSVRDDTSSRLDHDPQGKEVQP